MSSVSQESVLQALRGIQDPDLGKDIVTLGFVKDMAIKGGDVAFRIELTTPACPVKEEFRNQATALVGNVAGVTSVKVTMDAQVAASNPLLQTNSIPGVKNVIAVSSGKGGVGKSTVSVNLAVALAQAGASVGILDADVYGPNIPMMLGLKGKPEGRDGKIVPFKTPDGLVAMSMGFMVDEDKPLILRGPMIHSAIRQFLFEVSWGQLDYLIVDLPPGTGDAQLSLSQSCHLMGAILVTTPQDVSVHDVRKAVNMFKTVNVPVLGIVENMAGLYLSGKVVGQAERIELKVADQPVTVNVESDGSFAAVIDIFGTGGAKKICDLFDVPMLGTIPLDPAVREGGDAGRPVTMTAPDSGIAKSFRDLAGEMARRVSTLNLS